METKLNPGTHADDETSQTMAKAMERAFINQWSAFNGDRPPPKGEAREALRLMFVAVAQGVVQHLRDNPSAFKPVITGGAHNHVSGSNGSHGHTASIDSIDTRGTSA